MALGEKARAMTKLDIPTASRGSPYCRPFPAPFRGPPGEASTRAAGGASPAPGAGGAVPALPQRPGPRHPPSDYNSQSAAAARRHSPPARPPRRCPARLGAGARLSPGALAVAAGRCAGRAAMRCAEGWEPGQEEVCRVCARVCRLRGCGCEFRTGGAHTLVRVSSRSPRARYVQLPLRSREERWEPRPYRTHRLGAIGAHVSSACATRPRGCASP